MNALGFYTGVGTSGSLSWTNGINVVGNSNEFDINLIVTPGINSKQQLALVNTAIDMVEDRGECFYIADPAGKDDNIAAFNDAVSTLDTSFAGGYYPWVKIMDSDRNKPMWVPPSVIMPAVFAYNDKVGFEWFAPAGFKRGSLDNVIETKEFLNKIDLDSLYSNKVNPIATFNGEVVVWGQKTL